MQARVGRGAAKEQWVDGGEYTRDQHRSAGAAPGGEPPGRPRDARETRARILWAAGAVFAERGYEAATVRDIAARAGVNQALIFRYFGSKQALLTEVMAQDGKEQVSSTPPELLFETALRGVLAEGGGADADRLAVYLRSIGSADAAPETVRALGEEYAAALAALSEAEDGTLRAQLAMAWLLGIGLMRVVVRQEPLATADPDAICTHVLTALDRLLPVLPGAEPSPGTEGGPGAGADSGPGTDAEPGAGARPGAEEARPGVRP
ncbi:TetR/AcrR family transcriptional regulator [Streptomyces murinus]|uniref:TetR/AcrR family transcriptional regulator n=1 Tax=Streptomyces murinus TaxID=33900 RepID=UPI0027E42328|nr:TetR family transcriptional regulator [Streptomyces murinus]